VVRVHKGVQDSYVNILLMNYIIKYPTNLLAEKSNFSKYLSRICSIIVELNRVLVFNITL